MFPAGSLNHAIVGPPPGPRAMPFSSVAISPSSYRSKADSCLGQAVDGGVDVVDEEVEHGERGRHVVVLRVDERVGAAAEMKGEASHLLLDVEAEGLGVELLRARDVVRGEAGERSVVLEHLGSFRGQAARALLRRSWACAWTSRMNTAATVPAATANIVPSRNAAW